MTEKDKKIIISIFSIVAIIALVSGAVYAYFSFVTNGGNVATTNGKLDIDYNISDPELTGILIPSSSRSGGIMETATAKLKTGSVDAAINFYITPTSIQGFPLSALSYDVDVIDTSDNIVATYSGNFNDAVVNTPLKIVDAHDLSTSLLTFNIYLWLDGSKINNDNFNVNNSFTAVISADTVQITGEFFDTISEHITNLYNNASKSTATVNNITYNLASSVNLMNDRHASMSTDINGGDIRFYGANPNNYVWLGDTYISDYTIPGNITSWGYADKAACVNDGNNEEDCTEDTIRHSGDKKLWRVIGVFNGGVKLVQNDPIGNYSWDTSDGSVNDGLGINQWGPSGSYEGADLMRLLNPGYEADSINNSLYWTKGTGTVYSWDYDNDISTTVNANFANIGLSNAEKNMIDTVTWYTGACDNFSYVDAHYNAERGSMGKICSGGDFCNDTVTRTSTWNGKVGLISASDYGYAANLSQCNQILVDYYETGCFDTNWLKPVTDDWTMSPRAYSGDGYASSVFGVNVDGDVPDDHAVYGRRAVRPAVYLKSGVKVIDGSGTEQDPYVLR